MQVGNPVTEAFYDDTGILEYAWSHAVISDQQYVKAKQVCDFRQFNWSKKCNKAMKEVLKEYSKIDIYNIYAPACLLNGTSSSAYNRLSGRYKSLSKVYNEASKILITIPLFYSSEKERGSC